MTLTASQLARVKRALGIYAARFTDEQLQQMAGDAYEIDPLTWIEGTISEAFYTLALAAIDETDFRQGETQESRKVIYDRLWSKYLMWASKAGYNSLPKFQMQQIELAYIEPDYEDLI